MTGAEPPEPHAVVRVRGSVDVADIAAVLAALCGSSAQVAEPSGYERWRSGRVAAVRSSRRS